MAKGGLFTKVAQAATTQESTVTKAVLKKMVTGMLAHRQQLADEGKSPEEVERIILDCLDADLKGLNLKKTGN